MHSLLIALLLVIMWSGSCVSALAAGTSSPNTLSANDAKLTEAKGAVYKRDFIDWTRDQWGAPAPASIGDMLHEGMQVGTGDKSWAQITWPNVTARAWSNSVYAIAPNQKLVYLLNGEMLVQLNKKRDKKDAYFLWTNLIQARMRGTTVLVQTTATMSRVTVMEGVIDVLNRHDHSLVRLTPGVVYEVKATEALGQKITTRMRNAIQATGMSADRGSYGDTSNISAVSEATSPSGGLTPIADNVQVLPLFQTSSTVTSLLVANVSSLLDHPLLSAFTNLLPSLDLIKVELGHVEAILGGDLSGLSSTLSLKNNPIAGGITNQGDLLLSKSSQILSVPSRVSYNLGPEASKVLNLPSNVANFPPLAMIGSESPLSTTAINDLVNSAQTISPVALQQLIPYTSSTISPSLPGGGEIPGGATTILATPGIAGIIPGGVGGLGGAGGGGLVGGLTGTLSGALGGSGGLLGGLGGTVGGLGGTLGGLGGGLGGLGGGLGGLGGGLGGLGGGLGGLGGGLFP